MKRYNLLNILRTIIAFSLITGCSSQTTWNKLLNSAPGSVSNLVVLTLESAPDGTGSEISDITLNDGAVQQLYAIERDQSGTFVANVSASWNLSNPNLAYLSNASGLSVALTPNNTTGTEVVSATYSGLTATSGNIAIAYSVSTIPNLSLWFKAESLSPNIDGTALSYWNDSSSNGNNSLQPVSANSPLFYNNVNNGFPVVRFSNPAYLPINGSILVNTDYTVIIVAARNAYESGYDVILGGSSTTQNQDFHMGWRSDTVYTTDQWNNTADVTIPSFTTQGKVFQVWTDVLDQTQGRFTYLNNDLVESFTSSQYQVPLSASVDERICYWQAEGTYCDADVSEIIIYNRALTASEITDVQNYLVTKYSL
jgi:hypothetical protein